MLFEWCAKKFSKKRGEGYMTLKKTEITYIVIHGVLFLLYFVLLPTFNAFSPDGIGMIVSTIQQIYGLNSDTLIAVNILICVISCFFISDCAKRNNFSRAYFIKYLFLLWFFIIANQLYSSVYFIKLLEDIKSTPFVNLTILSFIFVGTGIIVFLVRIIRDVVINYLNDSEKVWEEQKKARDAELNKEKEFFKKRREKKNDLLDKKRDAVLNRLQSMIDTSNVDLQAKRFIRVSSIMLSFVLSAALLYSIYTENRVSVLLLSGIIGIAIGFILAVSSLKKTKEPSEPSLTRDIEDTGDGRHRELRKPKIGFPSLQPLFLIAMLMISILLLFAISQGTFNFTSIIRSFAPETNRQNLDLMEWLTSTSWISQFIIIIFIFIGMIFGGLLLLFVLKSILLWANNGKWPEAIEEEAKGQVPEFFLITEKLVYKLMKLIPKSLIAIVEMAEFIPGFIAKMKPVIFDHTADEQFRVQGVVINKSNGQLLENVEVYMEQFTKKNTQRALATATNSAGNYYLPKISKKVHSLIFKKEGYQSESIFLSKDAICDIELVPYVVIKGVVKSMASPEKTVSGVVILVEFDKSSGRSVLSLVSNDQGVFTAEGIIDIPLKLSWNKEGVSQESEFILVPRTADGLLEIKI